MLSLSHGTPLRASAGYVLPGSSQPYAAAVKNPGVQSFPHSALFLWRKTFIRPGYPACPCSTEEVREKYGRTPHFPLYLRYRSFSRISLSRFQLTASAAPLHHGRKTGVHAKEKACFRTVQDKFQGFRPVVLDLRQKYARLSLSH